MEWHKENLEVDTMKYFWKYNLLLAFFLLIGWLASNFILLRYDKTFRIGNFFLYNNFEISFFQLVLSVFITLIFFKKQSLKTVLYILILLLCFIIHFFGTFIIAALGMYCKHCN